MKKTTRFAGIALAALLGLPMIAAAQDVTVSAAFAPGSNTDLTVPNTNFTVRVTVTGLSAATPGLTAYDVRLNYSASDVKLTGISDLTTYLPVDSVLATPDPAAAIPSVEVNGSGAVVNWYRHLSGADLGGTNTPATGSASINIFDVTFQTTSSPAGPIKIQLESNRRDNRPANGAVYVNGSSPAAVTSATFNNTALAALVGAVDTDSDGVRDAIENPTGLNPPASPSTVTSRLLPDSDLDGLTDEEELNYDEAFAAFKDFTYTAATESNPRDRNSDGDLFLDGLEARFPETFTAGPLATDTLADADADGLPDVLDPNDASQDSDADKYNDAYEAAALGLAAVTDPAIVPRPNGLSRLGDVTQAADTVTIADALIIQRLTLGTTLPNAGNVKNIGAADVNGDGRITIADALLVQRYTLNTAVLPPVLTTP